MKIYRKKLDSLEALRREKIRLRYERRHTSADDLNPLSEMGRSKVTGSAKDGLLGFAGELFSAKSNFQTALAISKPLLKMLRNRSAKKQALHLAAGLPKKQSWLKKLVVEIATGYIIGKAMQMTVRGVGMLLQRRKAAKMKAKLKPHV